MKSTFAVSVLLLSGCATTYVQNNDPDAVALAQAKYTCHQQSRVSGGFGASGSQQFVAGAMVGAAIGVAIRQHSNFNACMQASGYSAS